MSARLSERCQLRPAYAPPLRFGFACAFATAQRCRSAAPPSPQNLHLTTSVLTHAHTARHSSLLDQRFALHPFCSLT